MKRQFIFLLCSLVHLNLHAQVPNGNFESWSNAATPQGWITSNLIAPNGVTRSTESYEGLYSAKITNAPVSSTLPIPVPIPILIPGSMGCGLKVNNFPLFLNGHFKSSLSGGSFTITITALKGQTVVATGTQNFEKTHSSFTALSIPLVYTSLAIPDSAYVLINSNTTTADNTLWVDFLSLDFQPLGLESNTNESGVFIYPNPTKEFLFARNLPSNGLYYSVMNSQGLLLLEGHISDLEGGLNLQKIAQSLYHLQVYDAQRTVLYRKQFIVTD